METILRATLLDARISKDSLSTEEQSLMTEAISDSYSETHPYSDVYASVLKKLDHWAYLDGDIENDGRTGADPQQRYLLYDDRYFDYILRFISEE